MKTPKRIADKRAVVNVRNDKPWQGDNRFFIWAILSCLRDEEVPLHKESYVTTEVTKRHSTSFPVQLNQIPFFENQNPDISVNVITIDGYDDFEAKYSFCIDYESPYRNRTHNVNLLLLEDEDDPTKKHYTRIRNFSRLMGDRTKHRERSYVCSHCLHVFTTPEAHDNHLPYCLVHAAQHVHYPVEDPWLSFKSIQKQHPIPFYLLCDFECSLMASTVRGARRTTTTMMTTMSTTAAYVQLTNTEYRGSAAIESQSTPSTRSNPSCTSDRMLCLPFMII